MPGINLKIEPQKLIETAALIQTKHAVIKNKFRDISDACAALTGIWEGESAGLYQNAMAELNQKAPGIESIFLEYVNDLQEISGLMVNVERESSIRAAGLKVDIFD